MSHRRRSFSSRADSVTWYIDKLEDGQVHNVAELEVLRYLLGAQRIEGTTRVAFAVVGNNADRMAIKAREAYDCCGAPERADLEERVVVYD